MIIIIIIIIIMVLVYDMSNSKIEYCVDVNFANHAADSVSGNTQHSSKKHCLPSDRCGAYSCFSI